MGGDAASNAAIVGGIVGAIVGIKRGISQQMLHALLRFDYEISPGETCYDVVKEEIFSIKKYGVHLTRQLLDNRPRESLKIIESEEVEFNDNLSNELPNEIHTVSNNLSLTNSKE